MKRDAKGKNTGARGSSATNWIDDASSFRLKSALDQLSITLPDRSSGLDRDEAISCLRWMKSTPVPLMVDLTPVLVENANETFLDKVLADLGTNRPDFFSRISLKLILMPSCAELSHSLVERTGTILFRKLLFGGVSRCRILGSSTSRWGSIRRSRYL